MSFSFLPVGLSDTLRQGAALGKIIPFHLSVKQLAGNESRDTGVDLEIPSVDLVDERPVVAPFLSLTAVMMADVPRVRGSAYIQQDN